MEIVVIILVALIIALITYNAKINKKIVELKDVNEKVNKLNILQEFMTTIGEDNSVENKIQKMNDILIEKYNVKYSTIVLFDGAEYVVKASNVDSKYWSSLINLHEQEIFKDSVSTAIPKYITVNNDREKLPYQNSEFGRAKTAIFLPLYIDNIYIGYWIIESGIAHDFEKLDTAMLELVKENILSVLKSVSYQSVVESLERKDLYSGLSNAEYLYGKGKKVAGKYPTSAVCMFNIVNIERINKEASREAGNEIITKVSEYVKNNISDEYLFVRYMGPKFVIVFSGIDSNSAIEFLQRLKVELENIVVDKEAFKVSPKLNFVITTYYKGTALEELNKKLEEYLNRADKDECNINLI